MRLLRHIPRQLRHHAPRMHSITQHPLIRVLRHDELGELEDRELGRLVRAAARTQAQRAHGADIDDRFRARAVLGAEKQRQKSFDHPVEAAVVDLPRPPVVVRVGVGDREALFQIAGVVDEDVEFAAEGVVRLLRRGLDARVIQHVEGEY